MKLKCKQSRIKIVPETEVEMQEGTNPSKDWGNNIMSELMDVLIKALQEQGWLLPRSMDHRLIYHGLRIRIRVNSYTVPKDHWDKTGSIMKRARWGIYNFMCRLLRM